MRFATPESRGIPSAAIERFVKKLNEREMCMHSFLMLRGDAVIAEGYWKPFDENFRHRMYSSSKSFVSMAIGMLAGDGKLSLDDKILSFFPEKMQGPAHPYMQAATIRHLLMMSTPHDENAYVDTDPDWVDAFLHRKPSHWPGLVFSYDTAGTVTLNAIVEKVSGQNLVDFLRPRLFDPIGVSPDVWCVGRPEGGAWGGSGMMCTTRDLALVANVCMHYGAHEGRQLIPEEYLREATSKQIDTRAAREEPETQQGYGYQFWMTRHEGFAFLGMGTQIAVCLPKKDFLLVTTADTQGVASGYANVFGALWDEIWPYLGDETLPEDMPAKSALDKTLSSLSMLTLKGENDSPIREKIDGKRYIMDDNPMGITSVSFSFEKDACLMRYRNAQGNCAIRFGFGYNAEGEFPQKGYYGRRIGEKLDRGYRCLCSAAWSAVRGLELRVNICDWYFGNLHIDAGFEGDRVTLHMTKTAEWFLNEYQGFAAGVMEK